MAADPQDTDDDARADARANVVHLPPRQVPPRAPRRRDVSAHPIGGLAAVLLILAVAGVWFLAHFVGGSRSGAAGANLIHGQYGLVAMGLIGTLFVASAWHGKCGDSPIDPPPPWRGAFHVVFGWLGHVLSVIDRELVLSVAALCGGHATRLVWRAIHFIAFFGAALAVTWLAPPAWGLVGAGVALVGVVALFRRWAWVEEDRRRYVITGRYDVAKDSAISLGFELEYRVVALTALIVLMAIMPLALRQASGPGWFTTATGDPATTISISEWMLFFGGEVAKAAPFLDWSEVYGAETATVIRVTPGWGQHAVFAVRALIDLLVLAGLIQALDLAGRWARQKEAFNNPNIPDNIVDPFMERAMFADIVAKTMPRGRPAVNPRIVAGIRDALQGPILTYKGRQIQRILGEGEAPKTWWPTHATAAAIIRPHSSALKPLPNYVTRLYRESIDVAMSASDDASAPLHWRTRVAGILSVMATTAPGYAEERRAALDALPNFLVADDPVVWSAVSSGLVEFAAHPDFPATRTLREFEARLAPTPAIQSPHRTMFYHTVLVELAHAEGPNGVQPHGEAAATLLIGHVNSLATVVTTLADARHGDDSTGERISDARPRTVEVLRLLRSAIAAIERLQFQAGSQREAAADACAHVADALEPGPRDVRRFAPWVLSQRVRRAAVRFRDASRRAEEQTIP